MGLIKKVYNISQFFQIYKYILPVPNTLVCVCFYLLLISS